MCSGLHITEHERQPELLRQPGNFLVNQCFLLNFHCLTAGVTLSAKLGKIGQGLFADRPAGSSFAGQDQECGLKCVVRVGRVAQMPAANTSNHRAVPPE